MNTLVIPESLRSSPHALADVLDLVMVRPRLRPRQELRESLIV